MTDPADIFRAIREEVGTVLVGNDDIVEGVVTALFAHGHVLLEGMPGQAKTTIAESFARATDLECGRVQMTPDLLPSDVTGTRVYHEDSGEFSVERGPVFTNVLIADEINRATPKTQSALLEAMQERSVTLYGETLALPEPFVVVATRNPIETKGTYSLPEAQRDRFMFRLMVDVPDEAEERALLDRFDDNPQLDPSTIDSVVSREELVAARGEVADVHVADAVGDYLHELTRETRNHTDVEVGASTRAMLALQAASKARAAIRDRDYVVPDDVKALAEPVFAHRLVLSTGVNSEQTPGRDVVEDVVRTVSPPSGVDAADGSDAAADDRDAAADD